MDTRHWPTRHATPMWQVRAALAPALKLGLTAAAVYEAHRDFVVDHDSGRKGTAEAGCTEFVHLPATAHSPNRKALQPTSFWQY